MFLELDGGPDGIRLRQLGVPIDGDGDGVAGGDFRLRMNVLPGNADGDRRVIGFDVDAVRMSLSTRVSSPGGPAGYDIWSDVNGDGRINIIDLVHVRSRQGDRLPLIFVEPAAAEARPTTLLRPRPVTRGLFSSEPILR